MNILVINAGSSSLKYRLFNMQNEEVLVKGSCERIGIDGVITHKTHDGRQFKEQVEFKNHIEAFKLIASLLVSEDFGVVKNLAEIKAVGHRIVHGAEVFTESKVLNEADVVEIEKLAGLAPLHNFAQAQAVRACWEAMGGDVVQVAVFDMIFHNSLPDEAKLYALPYEISSRFGIKKFGFHGSSHKFIRDRISEILGEPYEKLRIVSCHLGNGSSACAIKNGKSVETTMGMTPLDGILMGTRCGAMDPACVAFLAEQMNLNLIEVTKILNEKSGLLGVSGISSDYRDIKKAADSGNERAMLAIEMLAYSVRKNIATCVSAMDGVDVIVFTGGIGENSKDLIAKVGSKLNYLGAELDEALLEGLARGSEGKISGESSNVKIFILPANEEIVIARETLSLIKNS